MKLEDFNFKLKTSAYPVTFVNPKPSVVSDNHSSIIISGVLFPNEHSYYGQVLVFYEWVSGAYGLPKHEPDYDTMINMIRHYGDWVYKE